MQFGVWQLVIIGLIILVLFGRGKISEMMGDFGKGISSFKKGMNEDVDVTSSDEKPSAQIEAPAKDAAASEKTTDKTAG